MAGREAPGYARLQGPVAQPLRKTSLTAAEQFWYILMNIGPDDLPGRTAGRCPVALIVVADQELVTPEQQQVIERLLDVLGVRAAGSLRCCLAHLHLQPSRTNVVTVSQLVGVP
jgi:hypothetical protein